MRRNESMGLLPSQIERDWVYFKWYLVGKVQTWDILDEEFRDTRWKIHYWEKSERVIGGHSGVYSFVEYSGYHEVSGYNIGFIKIEVNHSLKLRYN